MKTTPRSVPLAEQNSTLRSRPRSVTSFLMFIVYLCPIYNQICEKEIKASSPCRSIFCSYVYSPFLKILPDSKIIIILQFLNATRLKAFTIPKPIVKYQILEGSNITTSVMCSGHLPLIVFNHIL